VTITPSLIKISHAINVIRRNTHTRDRISPSSKRLHHSSVFPYKTRKRRSPNGRTIDFWSTFVKAKTGLTKTKKKTVPCEISMSLSANYDKTNYTGDTWGLFSQGKSRPKCESNLSPRSSTEVKNVWNFASMSTYFFIL
jgi:hypothetical protein